MPRNRSRHSRAYVTFGIRIPARREHHSKLRQQHLLAWIGDCDTLQPNLALAGLRETDMNHRQQRKDLDGRLIRMVSSPEVFEGAPHRVAEKRYQSVSLRSMFELMKKMLDRCRCGTASTADDRPARCQLPPLSAVGLESKNSTRSDNTPCADAARSACEPFPPETS